MKRLVVIGDPIGHSLSPAMQSAALSAVGLDGEFTYERMKVPIMELEKFIEKMRKDEITGASVTMPDKEAVIPFLDTLTKEAELIQAVNTIHKTDGKLIGANTDGIGCIKALEEVCGPIAGKNVVLLGAGGAVRAISFALVLGGVGKLHIVNRTIENARIIVDNIRKHTGSDVSVGNLDILEQTLKDADILINATSVGMRGVMENQTLATADIMHSDLVVMDIVYDPRKTTLLKEAERAGAKIVDGSGMLLHQGAEQFEIFTGRKAPIEIMRNALLEALDEIGG